MQKDDSSRNMLVPRSQRYKQMVESNQILQSSDKTIVVPCLSRSFGFKTNQYQKYQQQLLGIIDRKDFQGFVRKSNRIVDEEISNKSKKEKEPFFNIISTLLKLSIGLGILSFVVLSIIVYIDFQSATSDAILTFSIVLILFSVLIGSLCPIFLYRSEYQEDNYQQRIKQRLFDLADIANQDLIAEGKDYLEWRFHEDFFWLEFRIDPKRAVINRYPEDNNNFNISMESPSSPEIQ